VVHRTADGRFIYKTIASGDAISGQMISKTTQKSKAATEHSRLPKHDEIGLSERYCGMHCATSSRSN
jgi:hypothetical protein